MDKVKVNYWLRRIDFEGKLPDEILLAITKNTCTFCNCLGSLNSNSPALAIVGTAKDTTRTIDFRTIASKTIGSHDNTRNIAERIYVPSQVVIFNGKV